jgi:hypothetical protein
MNFVISRISAAFLLINVAFAIDLNVKINVLNKNGNSLNEPINLEYYWAEQSDQNLRQIKLRLQFFVNNNEITIAKLIQSASIRIQCTQIPNNDPLFSSFAFDEKIISDLSSPLDVTVDFR